MKKISYFICTAIFLGFVLFISCGRKNNSDQLQKIDSLIVVLDELEKKIQTIDTAKIGEIYRVCNADLVFIQKNYKDTMDRELAIFLSDYHALKKSSTRLMESIVDQDYEIGYSKNQLKNLKLDLNNDLYNEDLFAEYFNSEQSAIEKMDETIQNTISWYQNAIQMFDTNSVKVKAIISDLKNEK